MTRPCRLLLMVLVLVATAAGAEVREQDFGAENDADPAAPIYLHPRESLRIGRDPRDLVQYEDGKRFFWAVVPRKTRGLITARVILAGHAAELRAQAFSGAPEALFLAVRFKDHLFAPVSLWVLAGTEWEPVGTLGGAFDHRWKTAVISIPGAPAHADGFYRFRIGREDGRDVMGEIPIDRVKLSTAPLTPEPDTAGFFPIPEPTRFAEIGATKSYRPGAGPIFPVGLIVTGGRTGTWKEVADLGVPMISFLGWGNEWRARWRVFSDGQFVDRVEAGLPEWLGQAEEHRLAHLPLFNTDGFSWFIRNVHGDERGALSAIGSTIRAHRRAKALLAWGMKTRTDADAPGEGCPLEFAMQLGNLRRAADPDRPTVMILRGEKPGVFRFFADATDIFAIDRYPVSEGEPLSRLGEAIDAAKEETGGKKAVWAIVEAYTEDGARRMGRQLAAREVLAQAYMALCHGADGIWFFVGSSGSYMDLSGLSEPLAAVKKFAHEALHKPDPVARILMPPYRTLDVMGRRGVMTVSRPEVHFLLAEGPGGTWHLIALNASDRDLVSVRFSAPGLVGGNVVVVESEERLIALLPGALVDNFAPWERHVYRFFPK